MAKISLIIYYLSYIIFPFIFYLFYKLKNWKIINKKQKIILILFYLLIIFFIDVRFIEPNYIGISTTKINIGLKEKVKIALIADLHLGTHKKGNFLKKVVKKINNIEKLEYVFIAGDLTYFYNKKEVSELEKIFGYLKKIKKPVYWVLGNHDVGKPGPNNRNNLIKALNKLGVHFLNNDFVKLKLFTLVGLGSNWGGEDNVSILNNFKNKEKIIVLTHNPDTILKYDRKIDLTLCGHTHGGQIKIPFLYKKVIPTYGKFNEGLTQEKNTKLFITSGLGEIGLPFRFLNTPVIDILEIN